MRRQRPTGQDVPYRQCICKEGWRAQLERHVEGEEEKGKDQCVYVSQTVCHVKCSSCVF